MTTQFPQFNPSNVEPSWFYISGNQDPEEELNILEKEYEMALNKIINKDIDVPIIGKKKDPSCVVSEQEINGDTDDSDDDATDFHDTNDLNNASQLDFFESVPADDNRSWLV